MSRSNELALEPEGMEKAIGFPRDYEHDYERDNDNDNDNDNERTLRGWFRLRLCWARVHRRPALTQRTRMPADYRLDDF